MMYCATSRSRSGKLALLREPAVGEQGTNGLRKWASANLSLMAFLPTQTGLKCYIVNKNDVKSHHQPPNRIN